MSKNDTPDKICYMSILFVMNAKISNTDIAIGAYLDARMKDKHLTQVDIAKAIGRKAQSYVSDRLTGKKSFLISELDIIAPMVGLPDSLALIAASVGRRRVE